MQQNKLPPVRLMKYILPLFIAILFTACVQTGKKAELIEDKNPKVTGPLVIRETITNEIAGLSYRKRATMYYRVNGKDTSNFRPIVKESKESGIVSFVSGWHNGSITHSERLEELKLLMPGGTYK